jgi:hypothetical protein
VIYYDQAGKLRKEASWKGWCDSKIPSIEFENTPRNNYVFNKGIRRYSDWGSGRSVIRVYDPRDFEFEISVDNLIGILMHSDVSKRDIVEECVFAWAGTELVLLPVNSEDYRESVEYTEKQDKKISAKSLVKGHVYSQRKQDGNFTYIGYYNYFDLTYGPSVKDKGKRHVFHDGSHFVIPSVGTLAECIVEETVDNYADLVDQYFKSNHTSRIVSFDVANSKNNVDRHDVIFYKKLSETEVLRVSTYHYGNSIKLHEVNFKYYTFDKDGKTLIYQNNKCAVSVTRGYYYNNNPPVVTSKSYEYNEILSQCAALGFNHLTLTPKTLATVLESLGYGNEVMFVNEQATKTLYYIY